MNTALLKYAEVAGIHARSQWAYLWDQLLANIHLVIIMFVFIQLWRVTYALRCDAGRWSDSLPAGGGIFLPLGGDPDPYGALPDDKRTEFF